jgi:hypothetical protein
MDKEIVVQIYNEISFWYKEKETLLFTAV